MTRLIPNTNPSGYWKRLSSFSTRDFRRLFEFLDLDPDLKFAEKKRMVISKFCSFDLQQHPCEYCGRAHIKMFKGFDRGFSRYCSSLCANRSTLHLREATCLRRYGARNVSSLQEFKDRKAQTCFRNHGVLWPQQSPEIRKKSVAIVQEKFGVDNVSQSQIILDRKRRTWLKNWGYDNPYKSPLILTGIKIRSWFMRGVGHHTRDPLVKEKFRETIRRKYGFDNPMQSPEIQQKVINTNLARYGVTNPMFSSEIFRKQQKNLTKGNKIKEIVLEGVVYCCYGYEPQVIEELISRGLSVNVDSIEEVPYLHNGKNRVYHPDIEVRTKSGRTFIVEVKSTWTLGLSRPEVYAINRSKFRAAHKQFRGEFYLVLVTKRTMTAIANPHRYTIKQLRMFLKKKGISFD